MLRGVSIPIPTMDATSIDTLYPKIEEIDEEYFYRVFETKGLTDQMEEVAKIPYVEPDDLYDMYNDEPNCKFSKLHSSDSEDYTESNFIGENINADYKPYRITCTDDGIWELSFHVSKNYVGTIVGKNRNTISSIESRTTTFIQVPNFGKSGDTIIRSLTSKSNVLAAYREIQLVITQAKENRDFTHFLSFSMATDEIKNRYKLFMENVMKLCDRDNVRKEMFQQSEKLHLTLGTMVLDDSVERQLAVNAMKKCEHILKEKYKPIPVVVKGIEYMNDDPSEVNVLYGKVEPTDGSNTLRDMANEIVEFFYEKGLIEKKYETVKLHMTLINTRFENHNFLDQSTEKKKRFFDATKILQNFGEFDFGKTVISSLHLSQRFTSDLNGYYVSKYSIEF